MYFVIEGGEQASCMLGQSRGCMGRRVRRGVCRMGGGREESKGGRGGRGKGGGEVVLRSLGRDVADGKAEEAEGGGWTYGCWGSGVELDPAILK